MPKKPEITAPEHGWPLGWGSSLREFEVFLGVERSLSPHTVSGYLSDLRFLAQYRMLAFGIILVLMMVFRPQGLIATNRRTYIFVKKTDAET